MLKYPPGTFQLVSETPVNAVAAALTTALTGTNNDLVFTAKTKGVAGDAITIKYTDPGADGTIAVNVVGTDIEVVLAYGTGAITSTAANVKTAIDGSAAAAALVSVANAAANDGTGLVTAMVKTPLASGVDGTEADAGEMYYDASYLYFTVAANGPTDANWRRVTLGSVY